MKENREELAFTSANYRLMLIGIGIITLGFTLMALEPAEFGFGILGLTVGPVIVVAGFVFQFYAILHEGPRPEEVVQEMVKATKESEPVMETVATSAPRTTKTAIPKNKGKKGAKRKK